MGKIEDIERQVQALSSEELAQFRAWFLEFDWVAWNHQIERDVQAGRLDALAAKALRDHASGKTTPLFDSPRIPDLWATSFNGPRCSHSAADRERCAEFMSSGRCRPPVPERHQRRYR